MTHDRLTFILVLAIFAVTALAFWDLLWVVVIAASLAVVILPLKRWFCRWVGEGMAAILTTSVVFISLVVAVGFTVGVLAMNAGYLAEIVQGILAWIGAVPGTTTGGPLSSASIATWAGEQVDRFGDWAGSFASEVPMLIIDGIVFFLVLFMFVFQGEAVAAEVTAALPARVRAAVERMTATSVDTLYAVYIVHVVTAVITFLLAIPFFWLLGYGHVLFFSVMAGIFQLIPILGPSLIMLFVGVYSLSIGDVRGAALAALIGYPIVCAFPDLYFRPIMMGRRAAIHPVIMWIGFFGGLAVMGIIGFILGPLFLALAVAGYRIFIEEMEGEKGAEV
jgi:predicted PurR-regulated permease PerM